MNTEMLRGADRRIAELEAEIDALKAELADMRELAYERAPRIMGEEARAQTEELKAQLAEARTIIHSLRHLVTPEPNEIELEAVERIITERDAAEARADAAEKRNQSLQDDIDELTFCEDCTEDCAKLPENGCYPPRYCHGCRHKLVERITAAESAAQRMREALEAVEWIVHVSYTNCPWCKAIVWSGHKPDCQRQLALAREGGGE